MTYQLIETKTLGTAAASIEFTSIPQDGTDLLVVASLRENGAAILRSGKFRFNGITTNTYVERLLDGNGSSASSANDTRSYFAWIVHNDTNSTANTFSNCQIYIPNYTSNTNKSVSMDSVGENNNTFGQQRISAGLWQNNAAINQITFDGEASNFVAGSTISLYKITKGTDGIVVVS